MPLLSQIRGLSLEAESLRDGCSSVDFRIQHLQLDNQLLGSSYPVVLGRKPDSQALALPSKQLQELGSLAHAGASSGISALVGLVDGRRESVDADDEELAAGPAPAELDAAEEAASPVLRVLQRQQSHPSITWFDAIYVILEVASPPPPL